MLANINDAIDEHGQGKAALTKNSKEVNDEEAKIFSTHTFDQDNVNHEPQKVEEEQRQTNIGNFDQEAPKEETIIEIPRIDFIFRDAQWKLEDCTQRVHIQIGKSYILVKCRHWKK
eukprot:TRINITY_DN44581_c2_g1_i1.p1 TRINITY_DN44581_c2_g1~~TRINITY_DN44581_c2_g1_i1.p1  ORF type:complete len:116 (-),score=20.82 TRINITY_DN44581_c2_g1_i1:294-641(-)